MEPEPSRFIPVAAFAGFLLAAPFTGVAFSVVALLALLYSSAMVSGSEVAFFALTPNDYNYLREEDSAPAKRILSLKERPRTLLATILISNNFVNIAIVVLSEYLFRQLLPTSIYDGIAAWTLDTLGLSIIWQPQLSTALHFTVTVVGVTFLLVLFGEVIPKIYSKANKISVAKTMSGPLIALSRILSPMNKLLVNGTSFIERRLERNQGSSNNPSREDIDEAIELTVAEDADGKREVDLLKSIVKFGDVTVKQIMRSRVDVVALDVTTDFNEVLATVRESGYSRIPVYEESFDQVVGVLYVKDLIGAIHKGINYEWQKALENRPKPMYVPESKRINELLKEFQSERTHMAIVVDEFGGTSGLVTLEDIIEEVIGDIKDEFDDDIEVEFEQIDDFNYRFEGKTLINDVCRVIGIPTDTFDKYRGDSDSLAGLMLERFGHMPRKDREFSVLGFRFKVLEANARRIEKVLVTLPKT